MGDRQHSSLFSIWLLLPLIALLCLVLYLGTRINTVEQDLSYRAPLTEEAVRGVSDALILHPVHGQTVYVPAYSHVYHQDGRPHLLTVTLSVRNTSFNDSIVLTSVRYYNTQGKEIRSHLEKPLHIAPLATTEFLVERDDTSGGSGANFIVEWIAESPVTEPIIETVMIDTSGQQGISFARTGTVISEKYTHDSREKLARPKQKKFPSIQESS